MNSPALLISLLSTLTSGKSNGIVTCGFVIGCLFAQFYRVLPPPPVGDTTLILREPNKLKPWLVKSWCIPEVTAEFLQKMEHILWVVYWSQKGYTTWLRWLLNTSGIFVGRKAGGWQTLMRSVVEFKQKCVKQNQKFCVGCPGFVSQPFFDGSYTKRSAIPFDWGRWRAMST